MQGSFITGTDTGVGKTLTSCVFLHALAQQGLRVAGYKPVASGCEQTAEGLRNEDALALIAHSNVPLDYASVNPYALAEPIAPHWAARLAGKDIDLPFSLHQAQALGDRVDRLIVEGAGGFLVPLNERESFADLAEALQLPVILVVGLRLGAINHALLTAEAVLRRGLTLAGWVGNAAWPEPIPAGTIETLETRMPAPRLATFSHQYDPDISNLAEALRLDML